MHATHNEHLEAKQQAVIAVGTLGGTITMTASASGQGVDSTLGAEQLMYSIPGLDQLNIALRLQTLANVASGSIRFADLFKALAWAREQVEQGTDGVVLVQGTDTLEESAFLLDLYWPYSTPLIMTGAMRSPYTAGAEGSANLLAAVQVASNPATHGHGVLVVMNDEIHQARYVRKTHTTALNAFSSPVLGPVGLVLEGQAVYLRAPALRRVLSVPQRHEERVLLLETTLDEPVQLYTQLPQLGYSGLVIAGVGSGHVSIPVRDVLMTTLAQMPVLMSSRTGGGSTTKAVYAYPGSELDLQAHGVMMMGSLCPRKVRLLLSALLWQGLDREALERWLNEYLQLAYGYSR